MIWKLIKLLLVLVVLVMIALIAFAYIGPIFMADAFVAPSAEIRVPVEFNLEQ